MGMTAFELFGVLKLDKSEFDRGLSDATKSASGLGTGLANAIGIGVKAIAAAGAAVYGFGATAVKVGSAFDQAMGGVAATMGKSMEEMEGQVGAVDTSFGHFEGTLRDFAMYMGKNTVFSATEAAGALNYMALAGYNTQESMEMLPAVLDMAAAGAMDLAKASDMITDTQRALGLDFERTSQMVDEFAKAASTGNTSVEQLGDAFLRVGGLASELNGGMVTLADGSTAATDGVQELEIAFTAMANAGVKGTEAGTHMRNMLLKLSSPTKDGAAALEEMGVSIFDAEGNMRSLSAIFGDLNTELSSMTQEGRIQVISDLFNTRDLASAEALLSAVGQDWDKIGESILDAEGAATQMSNTKLDNLTGDMTLFKSALETAQITINDQLSPSLREFVQLGTKGIQKVTTGFESGGLTGAMEAFGSVLSEVLNLVIQKLPQFISAGTQLIGALGQGLLDNLPVILDAATQILSQLGQSLVTAAPALLDGAAQIIGVLGQYLIENGPNMITAIGQIILQIVTMLTENASQLVNGAIALLTGLGKAFLENTAVLLPAIIQLLVAIGVALIDNLPLLIQSVIEIITMLVQIIIENAPLLLDAVIQILAAIVMLFVDYGVQVITAAGEWLSNLVTTVGQWLSTMINTFITWLSQLPTQMAYWAGFAIGSFIKFFMELPGRVMNFLSNVIAKVQDFGSRLKTRATEIAQAFFNNLVTKISELPGKLAELGQSMVDAILDLPDKFMEIGGNIVKGIWEGIKAGWDWLVSSVKDLANSLLEGAKDALGIASPSKEFAWVGKMIDEGLALGVTSNLSEVRKAMDSMIAETRIPIEANGFGSVYDGNSYAGYGFVQNLTINSPRELNPSEIARQTRNANREMVLRMRTT